VHISGFLSADFGRFSPSPNLRRRLRAAFAFTAGGLVACSSAVALLVNDSVPLSAFSPAPAASQSPAAAVAAAHAAVAALPAADAVHAQKIAKPDPVKSCPGDVPGNCGLNAAPKPAGAQAKSNPPAPAAIPVVHNSAPAAAGPKPPAVVASPPPAKEVVSPPPAKQAVSPPTKEVVSPPLAREAAREPAAADAAPTSLKPRKKARRKSNRSYSHGNQYRGDNFAGQLPWRLFFR
jgi:hypothetical protein